MSAASIQAEALSLPAQERGKLIDLLWDSLSLVEVKSHETAWATESERRIDPFESAKLKARDAGTPSKGINIPRIALECTPWTLWQGSR